MMLSTDESLALAHLLIEGDTYRMTITDCCIGSVTLQGKLVEMVLGDDDGDLVFQTPDGTMARLYAWALPADLEQVP